MNLANLKFIAPTQVASLANTSTPIEDKSSKVLCQNCHVNERANSNNFLCDECIAENEEILRDRKLQQNGALPVIEAEPTIKIEAAPFNMEDLPLETNSKSEPRPIRFAPPSVRYNGKQLDEIAWAMLPALPESISLDINRIVVTAAREYVSQELTPTIQDIDVMAECCLRLHNMLKELGTNRKEKIKLDARPEYKRQEKERREKEKAEKIQKAIPKDVVSKHTANILLKGIATIVAPPDKASQSIIKAFLDHVQLQSQVEDEITAAWLTTELSRARYAPIKSYFKINQAANQ